jgi:hypothetical protein
MKFRILSLSVLSFAVMMVFALVSCEGPEGPAGAIGPAGPAGPAGPEGQAGTTNCIECHGSSQLLTSKLNQYAASIHATGGNYERNSASCAACHTSQGFLDRMATGSMEASGTVEDPLGPNCYTCHKIHSTYTTADWELTYTAPVEFMNGKGTFDQGKANLCANCHQPRPAVIPGPDDTGLVNVSSSRYGPHHGPQSQILAGVGGVEFGGNYSAGPHGSIENGCITCHMASAFGNQSGGHVMNIAYVYHDAKEYNFAGCADCHDPATIETKFEDTQHEIETLLEELKTLLIDKGIYNTANDLAVTGDHDAKLVGAYYNFIYIEEDRSLGVHNPSYTKRLLEQSIAAID